MKRNLLSVICAVLIACILLVGATVKSKTTWEYNEALRSRLTEAQLNELGTQGWELAGLTYDSNNDQTTYIFKRPK